MTPKMASLHAGSGQLRDARCYPRYRTRLPVTVTLPNGKSATVYSGMISMRGMELDCDKLTSRSVLGKDLPNPPSLPAAIRFSIDLPAQPAITINGVLKILNSRRIAETHYVLGAEYQQLKKADLDQLASFLEEFTPVP